VNSPKKKRNKDFEKNAVEELFKNIFGVKNFIWIPYCSVYDDTDLCVGEDEKNSTFNALFTTDGHVDAYAVFSGNDTIMYETMKDVNLNDEMSILNHQRVSLNLETLKHATNSNGEKFKLVPLPSDVKITKKNP